MKLRRHAGRIHSEYTLFSHETVTKHRRSYWSQLRQSQKMCARILQHAHILNYKITTPPANNQTRILAPLLIPRYLIKFNTISFSKSVICSKNFLIKQFTAPCYRFFYMKLLRSNSFASQYGKNYEISTTCVKFGCMIWQCRFFSLFLHIFTSADTF